MKQRAPWVALGLAGLGTLAYALFVAAGSPDTLSSLVTDWIYNAAILLCAVACGLRGVMSTGPRAPWIAFGLGLASWTLGSIYYSVELRDLVQIPYPSLADAGYLLSLPCFFVGVALLAHHRVGRFSLARWIDGAIAALAAGAIGSALLAPALIGATNGSPAAVMTNLAYPLGDMILIAMVLGAVVVGGARGARAFLLIGAGLAAWAFADALYLYLEATNSYAGGWIDLGWLLGALGMALGACSSVRHSPTRKVGYRPAVMLPASAASLSVSILIWDHFNRLGAAPVWLAGATLVVVGARLAVSFAENERLVAALRHESASDALTGLGNRRQLMEDLDQACAEGAGPHHLALFDLDGFKSYNDSFGHPAGDALLCQLGGRLAETVGPGRAYRLGGDEFCVLVPADEGEFESIVEAAREALSARGQGFRIETSCGHAAIPAEAGEPSEALGLVDTRMFAEKGARSIRVAHQTHELLLRILREREPALGEHVDGVARLATAVARAFLLDPEERDEIHRAAELHDIGKIAMPEGMLSKPGPLNEREWDLMRRHTLVGERILGAAPALRPVGELVRASHERWDGHGYPDGLSGEAIPLGARIVFVCDAFEAMTAERPYGRRRSEAEAIEELRRNAGSQFDPAVVEVFVRLWSGGRAEPSLPAPPLSGASAQLVGG